ALAALPCPTVHRRPSSPELARFSGAHLPVAGSQKPAHTLPTDTIYEYAPPPAPDCARYRCAEQTRPQIRSQRWAYCHLADFLQLEFPAQFRLLPSARGPSLLPHGSPSRILITPCWQCAFRSRPRRKKNHLRQAKTSSVQSRDDPFSRK